VDKSGCSIDPMHLCIRRDPLNPAESPLYSTRIKSRSSLRQIHVLLPHFTIHILLYTPFRPLHSILYLLQFEQSYDSFVTMSILGKHRLGVSSPLPPSHTIYEPPKPLSRDLEDLESLIRSLADELERAEDQKAMQKSDSSTGTGSPDLLATPVTASNSPISDMGDQVVTPPPVRHREHPSKSASREGRGGDEKARHARVKERSGVSASTGSEGKRTRSDKPRREKVDEKSSSKPAKEEQAQSTRTRSRREGLDGSSDKKKVPIKRSEIRTFIRIALLCKQFWFPMGL
jgi:hypothetical protein